VHRSYVINLRRVVEFRRTGNKTAMLLMTDGSEVPVARRHVAALRASLLAP
jgi:DNA-binding LytR/AlgR family response regulator